MLHDHNQDHSISQAIHNGNPNPHHGAQEDSHHRNITTVFVVDVVVESTQFSTLYTGKYFLCNIIVTVSLGTSIMSI